MSRKEGRWKMTRLDPTGFSGDRLFCLSLHRIVWCATQRYGREVWAMTVAGPTRKRIR